LRILFDQVVFEQRNKGNVALLQAAVDRLNRYWPDATLEVLTEAPYLLKLYCPNTRPVSLYPWNDWSQGTGKFGTIQRLLPESVQRLLFELRDGIKDWRANIPAQAEPPQESRHKPVSDSNVGDYSLDVKTQLFHAIYEADLIVVTGGGFICDSEKPHILKVLKRLEIASQLNKPTVMVGQGIGPVTDAELEAKLRSVLPSVSLMLIREQKVGRPLLESLGVPLERIIMTGDDAVEMAYEARTSGWGMGLGINLRLSHYTEVKGGYIGLIKPVIQRAALNFNAKLISIPISQDIREADSDVIRQLIDGYDNSEFGWQHYETPYDLIKKVGRCRLVVTGAFHAAVFALSQGIPAIGLVKSEEYVIKFTGLKEDFGEGCEVIHLDDDQLQNKLTAAIDSLWTSAENLRPQLLDAARKQIEWGHAGYQRIYELMCL